MTAKIKLNAASGGGSISIQAPSSSSNNRVISLPDIADGTLVTSQSTLDATKLSGALPAISGANLTGISAGKLLQVVQTMKTDTFSSTTGSTWTDITGVSVNITPSSASNKILVSFHGGVSASNDSYSWLRLARVIGGTTVTNLCQGDSRNNTIQCTLDGTQGVQSNKDSTSNHSSFEFLDSPNTTSQITYKMQFYKAMGNHFFIGGTYSDFDSNKGSVPTFITVKEIAA